MNNLLIICLSYGVYLVVVGLVLAGAWYSEKLDPENDLPASIWDEILPPDRPRAAAAPKPSPVALGLGPALSGKRC